MTRAVVFCTLLLLGTSSGILAGGTDTLSIRTPESRVDVLTSGIPSPGYYLLGCVVPDSIGLVDAAGVLLFPTFTGPSANLTPSPYGGLTYYDGKLGKYVLLDNRLRAIDTFGVEAPYTTDFHEGYQARGRRFIVLGTEDRAVDMSTRVANGRYDAIVIGAVIQEFDRFGRKTFEWKSLDHLSPLEATPDVDLTAKRIDYIHLNSISEDTDRNFLISCRNLDQVIKINRTTGEIIWRLGGSAASASDFVFVNDDNSGFHGFSHQHSVQRAQNGDILLFDNGNLRPLPFSRAVAYRLNEELKTATKTWEYISEDMQMAATMGSVQELPNGNILVGWGTTPTNLVASEVDRSGTLHAQVTSPVPIPVPYRVKKAAIGMTASIQKITTPGTVVFAQFDSTTRVSATVEQLRAPSVITVEKHSYVPHNLDFADNAPCTIFPIRWVIRGSGIENVVGWVNFDCSRLLGDVDIEDVRIYHRSIENEGLFTILPSALLSRTQTRSIHTLLAGEYVIAAPHCSQPSLRVPDSNSVVGTSIRMEWTEALGADGYELEISEDPSFGSDSRMYRTLYNDTTMSGFTAGSTYYWRVRVVRQPEVGPWTVPWSFVIPVSTSVEEHHQPLLIEQYGNVLVASATATCIELFDVTGRIILRVTNPNHVDITHIPAGVYTAVVTTESNHQQRMIITR